MGPPMPAGQSVGWGARDPGTSRSLWYTRILPLEPLGGTNSEVVLLSTTRSLRRCFGFLVFAERGLEPRSSGRRARRVLCYEATCQPAAEIRVISFHEHFPWETTANGVRIQFLRRPQVHSRFQTGISGLVRKCSLSSLRIRI